MRTRLLTLLVLGLPATFAAQTHVVVTFSGTTVKLYANGRRLYTLDKQFVRGRVLRVWLGGQDEGLNAVYLAGGEVIEMVTIVFSAELQNPAGKSASLGCWLEGWSKSESKFNFFNSNATNPASRTTASVTPIQTSWVW